MKEKIIKYWKDPVLSKIIAIMIISIVTIIYNFIKSFSNQTNFLTEFNKFWNFEIKLWIITSISIIFYLVYFIKKRKKTFKYDKETIELDKTLFDRIRNELVSNETIYDFRTNIFSSHNFNSKKIDFIYLVSQESKNPEFEFLNPNLEQLKLEFLKSLENFEKSTLGNLFSANSNGYIGIPREWDYERFHKAVGEISTEENNVCEKFDDFIKKGRRILKV